MSRRKNQGRHAADTASWSATQMARDLVDARDRTMALSAGNPFLLDQTVSDMQRGLATYARTVARSGAADPMAEALEFTGRRRLIGAPLTESALRDQARVEIAAAMSGLAEADCYIVSPAMHATTVAAAYTLTDEEAVSNFCLPDLPSHNGLLMLPQHLIICADEDSVPQDFIAFSWSYDPMRSGHELRVHTWLDVYGPVQVETFQLAVTLMREAGKPMPPWMTLGMTGVRCTPTPSQDDPREIDITTRSLLDVNLLNRTSDLVGGSRSVHAEYDGESAVRASSPNLWCLKYLLAFFRLTAQRTAVVSEFREGVHPAMRHHPHHDTRVVQLRTYNREPRSEGEESRKYYSRFSVRMHKVNQWYPSEGVHKLIWRGPFMKGPVDGPLIEGTRVTAVR